MKYLLTLFCLFLTSCTMSVIAQQDEHPPPFVAPNLRPRYENMQTVAPGTPDWKSRSKCRGMINHECIQLEVGAYKVKYLNVGMKCAGGMDFLVYGEGYILWRKHLEPGQSLSEVNVWVPHNATLFVGLGDHHNEFGNPECYLQWAGER